MAITLAPDAQPFLDGAALVCTDSTASRSPPEIHA